MSSTLIIGNHFWGHGDDLAQAKKTFTAQGGKLSKGYTIVEFEDGQEFHGVDQLGRVHWKNDDNSDREPASKDVPPRKKTS